MEANELMKDDWVQVTNLSLGIVNRIGRVIGIDPREGSARPQTFTISFKDDGNETYQYVGCRKYNVLPIPLTQEILEKNGFTDWHDHSRTTRSCPILLDKRTSMNVQVMDGSDSIFTQIHSYGANSCEFRMNLKYVHQLQHAIRLCSIDKEITL